MKVDKMSNTLTGRSLARMLLGGVDPAARKGAAEVLLECLRDDCDPEFREELERYQEDAP